jgi:hypothetical protein
MNKVGSYIKKTVEENWNKWTLTGKKYSLITKIQVINNDLSGDENEGTVTEYLDFCIGANDIKTLENLWFTDYFYYRYDTSTQHFIVDNEEKKVIKFLSICT